MDEELTVCRLSFGRDTMTGEQSRVPQFRTEMIRCPQMSSIKYHEPTHRILLTSREPDHSCGIYLFSPLVSEEDGTRGRWMLGESESCVVDMSLMFEHVLIHRL
jgi:hypothetical protein